MFGPSRPLFLPPSRFGVAGPAPPAPAPDLLPKKQISYKAVQGAAQSIDESECSRPRSASRIQTPPLQRCTHRTPGCAPLKRRRHSPARSTCAAAPVLRSSPLGADMVRKSRNSFSDVLFTQELMALIPLTIWCVRAQSVRNFVTEFSGGAALQRCGVAQSWSSELATQAHSHPIPQSPHDGCASWRSFD